MGFDDGGEIVINVLDYVYKSICPHPNTLDYHANKGLKEENLSLVYRQIHSNF